MSIQAVRFDRRLWTMATAEAWLRRHNMHSVRIDITPAQLRYRIRSPGQFKKMVAFTPKLKSGRPSRKGVSFVLGYA